MEYLNANTAPISSFMLFKIVLLCTDSMENVPECVRYAHPGNHRNHANIDLFPQLESLAAGGARPGMVFRF
jgi:hypothetical protein